MHSEYCFKFNLYTKHSIVIDGNAGETHPHTFNISVYIKYSKQNKFNDIENIINNILNKYQSQNLNTIPPFDSINPTLENIGNYLFDEIKLALKENGLECDRMTISENPTRTYLIDKKTAASYKANSKSSLIDTVSYIKNVIEYIADDLSKKNKLTDTQKASSQELPEPVAAGNEDFDIREIRNKLFERNKQNNTKKEYKTLKVILSILVILLSAGLLLIYINTKGNYPWGSDSFGHIFKADMLYKNIKEGNFYPLFTEFWYNGIQPFRYWAPFPYYLLASLQFLTNGNPILAYNLFIAVAFISGSLGWLLMGIKENKIFLSTVIGMLFFAMPDNIRVLFSEGNLPRAVIAMLLPFLFYFIWLFMEYDKKHMIIPIMFFLILTVFSHLMIAAMLMITVFIYLLYYGIVNKKMHVVIEFSIASVISLAMCGIWLYPALQGGLFSIDSTAMSEVMRALTFPFTQTLNPFLRLSNIEIFYFGLSFFLIALMGLILSNKKSIPGFLTVITIFLGTTTAFVPILIKLPFNQLLWMMRFTPIAYCVFIISVINWKNLKRYALLIVMIVLIIDSFVSFKILAFNTTPSPEITKMLDDTKNYTNQRVAIMDLSEFGSYPSFYLCTGEDPKLYSYGWAWQGAKTSQNIVFLNTALEKGYYTYIFDRCFELGCDTILFKKDKIDKIEDEENLFLSAKSTGYYLVKEYNLGYLFKKNTPLSFGVKVKYYGLAIGRSAANIVLEYPGFEIAFSDYLDNYSLEELLQYEVIYISEFKYRDKKKAEKLILDAAQAGVQVVVDMNRVPNDPFTNRLTFLDVTAQPIQFEHQLPALHVAGVVTFPVTFKEEFKVWNTVYLENVPNPLGFSWFAGNKLVFIGKHHNPNITFIAFNILYFGIENEDQNVIDIFGTVIGRMENKLPDRVAVPIDITRNGNKISILSPQKDVGTTLAFLDAFKTDDEIYQKHNLLFISENKADIEIIYPYLYEGIALTCVGFIFCVIFLCFLFKKRGEKQ